MNCKGMLVAAAGLAALAGVGLAGIAGTAAAQEKVMPGIVGSAPSKVAGCPYVAWRLARHPDGTITGIVYYSDLSGVSMATGSANQAGQFNLKLTSQMGNGPVGDVVGQRSKSGAVHATLTGSGCANLTVDLKPVSNMATYHETAG